VLISHVLPFLAVERERAQNTRAPLHVWPVGPSARRAGILE
jgi:hypothetical protein